MIHFRTLYSKLEDKQCLTIIGTEWVPCELLSIGVEKHQAAFSSGTWLTGTPLTYLAPW